jgi:hypothetical protein
VVSLNDGERERGCLTKCGSEVTALAIHTLGQEIDAGERARWNVRDQIVHRLWETSESPVAAGFAQLAYLVECGVVDGALVHHCDCGLEYLTVQSGRRSSKV